MEITSTAFANNEYLTDNFSYNGGNQNPPLTFSQIPDNSESLALIVEDPDAPNTTFTHWLVYNMTPVTMQILQGEVPQTGVQGKNDYGDVGYGGPNPPSETHRYFFKLYALDTTLDLPEGASSEQFYEEIDGHVLETAEIIGKYQNPDTLEALESEDKDNYTDDRNTSDGQLIGG